MLAKLKPLPPHKSIDPIESLRHYIHEFNYVINGLTKKDLNLNTLTLLEWSANAFYLVSIALAARNNIHTWWTGIIGTVLFSALFFKVQLYADVTLMVFYLGTSIYGWMYWKKGNALSPIRATAYKYIVLFTLSALVTTIIYGAILYWLTNAYAPFVDSAVLMFSVLAQLLLMKRRLETWIFWIVVDTLAVPLYISRELYLTGILYIGFWFNAWYGLYMWSKDTQKTKVTPTVKVKLS
ncbi:MAG: nicotinamide mononucleotide transporter [Reinekea sp.]